MSSFFLAPGAWLWYSLVVDGALLFFFVFTFPACWAGLFFWSLEQEPLAGKGARHSFVLPFFSFVSFIMAPSTGYFLLSPSMRWLTITFMGWAGKKSPYDYDGMMLSV
ncbi:hypothetical protein B0I37DRAFT_363526 [Chaetomium sp. MPI-CAGE-AT-0009]|nr:hypothetical protein B0I37DRAFT_363526 [Chaetomium sp. MPI-CAGE-AT-0009]